MPNLANSLRKDYFGPPFFFLKTLHAVNIKIFEHTSRINWREFLLANYLPISKNLNGSLLFVLCAFSIGLCKQRISLQTFGQPKPARFILRQPAHVSRQRGRQYNMQIVATLEKKRCKLKCEKH